MLKKFRQQISCVECSSPPTTHRDIYLPSRSTPPRTSTLHTSNNYKHQHRSIRLSMLSDKLNASAATSGYSSGHSQRSYTGSSGHSQRSHTGSLKRPTTGSLQRPTTGSLQRPTTGSLQRGQFASSRPASYHGDETRSGGSDGRAHTDRATAKENDWRRSLSRQDAVDGGRKGGSLQSNVRPISRESTTDGCPKESHRREVLRTDEQVTLRVDQQTNKRQGIDPEIDKDSVTFSAYEDISPSEENHQMKANLFRRRRSISFAGNTEHSDILRPRKRSQSVTDSDGPQSTMSGDGLENTLINFVKREWQSQVLLSSDSEPASNGIHLKSILKNRVKSSDYTDSEYEAAERKQRSTSVSFLDTKYNQAQLFNSSRYRKDDVAVTKHGHKDKHKHKDKHAKKVHGKPPLPNKHNEVDAKRMMDKYHNIRTTHNRSPPLGGSLPAARRTSKDSTDSGAYSSSISSSQSDGLRHDPAGYLDDPFSSPAASVSSSNSSCERTLPLKLSPNGESIPDIIRRPNSKRRLRRPASDASTVSSSQSDDHLRQQDKPGKLTVTSRNPWEDYHRQRDEMQRGEQTESPSASSDNHSSDNQVVWHQHPRDIHEPLLPTRIYRAGSHDSLSSSDGELDKTLCKEDSDGKNRDSDTAGEQDNTLCDTHNSLSLNRNNNDTMDHGESSNRLGIKRIGPAGITPPKNNISAHIIPDAIRTTPSCSRKRRTVHSTAAVHSTVPRATSVENIRTGKKVTTFEHVQSLQSDSESDASSIAESAGHMRRNSMDEVLNNAPSNKQAPSIKTFAPTDTTANYFDDGYSQQDSLHTEYADEQPTSAMMQTNTLDWDLSPEDLPSQSVVTTGTVSLQDWEQMSDMMLEGTEDDLKSFMDQNDLSRVLIPSNNIRTGRLMMKGLNDKEDRINLLKNVMSLRQLSHRHVQGVYGMALEGSPYTRDGREVMILHERTHYLVTLKHLLAWISDNNPKLLTPSCAVTFALQLCEGLQFLQRKGIIHANLSSNTVRLDRECQIKLGGIEQFPVSSTPAPIRWMSLETLSSGTILPSSITWTFGVLVWEIVSLGARPYNNLKIGQILHRLNNGYRLPRPAGCTSTIYQLLLTCWLAQPEKRPSFLDLHTKLLEYQQKLPVSKPAAELFPDREDFWTLVQDHI